MGWSDLPSELVIKIAENLTEFIDYLRFRSVCSNWRSSFHFHSHSLHLPRQLPWLAFLSTSANHFYSLSKDRIYPNPPPSINDNFNLFGSASGWFLSIIVTNTFSLINPFTCASIGLPSPNSFWSLSYEEADTLVWDCSNSVVVATCSTRPGVFYCGLGDATWTMKEFQQCCIATSITFYEGRFYILQVDTWETVVLDGETLEQITVINPSTHWTVRFLDGKSYIEPKLFVLSGKLLLLDKFTWSMDECCDNDLHCYIVRRTNLNDELVEWIRVNDIGDRALFVDKLHCFSVKVGDNCQLKRNCIYSLHCTMANGSSMHSLWKYCISIFDLQKNAGKCLEGALSKFLVSSPCDADPPPSWVLPSLN